LFGRSHRLTVHFTSDFPELRALVRGLISPSWSLIILISVHVPYLTILDAYAKYIKHNSHRFEIDAQVEHLDNLIEVIGHWTISARKGNFGSEQEVSSQRELLRAMSSGGRLPYYFEMVRDMIKTIPAASLLEEKLRETEKDVQQAI
jgi:hypothetical protein